MNRGWQFAIAIGSLAGTVLSCALFPSAAGASDPGLFGLKLFGENSPVGAVAYKTNIRAETRYAGLRERLQRASLLVEGQSQGANDTAELAALARADIKRLSAVLYAEGYYGATIDITIGGTPLAAFQAIGPPSSTEQLEVAVAVTPGPRFAFGAVSVAYAQTESPGPPIAPEQYGLIPGKPARSSLVTAALDRVVNDLKRKGFALARVVDKKIVADHAARQLDVAIVVAAGAPAKIGTITVVGTNRLDASKINAHTALRPGQQYDPVVLGRVRERLRKFESIESVRIREGKSLGPDGALPITVEVRERKDRFVGASASLSSIDGLEVQTYWGHRNLLGGGEVLRIVGTVSGIGSNAIDDLDYKLSANMLRPGVFDIDTDLVSEISVARERPDTFDSKSAKLKVALTKRFSRQLTTSVGLEGSVLRVTDEANSDQYALLGLPGEIAFDTRDRRLDPAKGWRAALYMTPYFDLMNDDGFVSVRHQASYYLALDPEQKIVLAMRAGMGSVFGAGLADIPATHRFFAGGGGSVRGFGYRSIGVDSAGSTIGGRSIVDGSLELRYRLTPTIGLVPFVDAGTVSAGSIPSFADPIKIGAGLGLRYYTALGPIRLDLAFPVDPIKGDPRYAIYVGLGQAF